MPLRIITAGGTIDKTYFDALSTYQVGDPQVIAVITEANVVTPYVLEGLFRKDSLEVTEADRAVLRQRIECAAETQILITHGTDTMAETAEYLQGIPGKVIVLTGAMQPACLRKSDASFNIGFAFAAVQTAAPGVYIAMNGQLLLAGQARKNRSKGVFEPCQ